VTSSAELRARLEALAAFADELEAPDFDAGTWHDSERSHSPEVEGEVWTMPWFELSERAEAFVRSAASNGWVRPFDWMRWVETDEAMALRDDRAKLANATPDQLQRLLTAVIRADRFSEGSLAWAFETGLVAAIARRAGNLADELTKTPDA
jgi:uncharacterized protein DUF6508